VDVRIGIVQSPKELEVELADDADREQVLADIEAALGGGRGSGDAPKPAAKGAAKDVAVPPAEGAGGVLWLTDRRGRRVAVPVAKIAYVEVGAPTNERRVGFGAP
jgi:hypothetical protein